MAEAVKAARSVLLETARILGEYRDNIVVIGGWVPELLISSEHTGSIDVDLALNHLEIQEESYNTIKKLLLSRGYIQGEQPYIFIRQVNTGAQMIDVHVDLLSGEYEGTGVKHRTQRIQDLKARKARGSELAFENYKEVKLEETLPGGGKDSAVIRVASIVPFIVMKGMALNDRLKEKDAWDIYFCLKRYPGGIDALVNEFLPHIGHGLVQEGLRKVAEKFSSPASVGPKFVADFEEITDPEEREIKQRDAFEQVGYLMEKLGVDF
jgi:hypothetical protein